MEGSGWLNEEVATRHLEDQYLRQLADDADEADAQRDERLLAERRKHQLTQLQTPPVRGGLSVQDATGSDVPLLPGREEQQVGAMAERQDAQARHDAATAKGRYDPETNPEGAMDPVQRLVHGWERGAAGVLAGTLRYEHVVEQWLGLKTPVGRWGLEQAHTLEAFMGSVSPQDPGFLDKLGEGIGSTLVLFPVGGFSASAVKAVAPRLAKLTGAGVMAITEAGAEAGNAHKVLAEFLPAEEAARRANAIFAKNLALLMVTNKAGMWSDNLRGLYKLTASMAMEGGQELVQEYTIQRDGLTFPLAHPKADLLKRLGWVESGEELKLPMRFTDAAQIVAVAAVLGGGQGLATQFLYGDSQGNVPMEEVPGDTEQGSVSNEEGGTQAVPTPAADSLWQQLAEADAEAYVALDPWDESIDAGEFFSRLRPEDHPSADQLDPNDPGVQEVNRLIGDLQDGLNGTDWQQYEDLIEEDLAADGEESDDPSADLRFGLDEDAPPPRRTRTDLSQFQQREDDELLSDPDGPPDHADPGAADDEGRGSLSAHEVRAQYRQAQRAGTQVDIGQHADPDGTWYWKLTEELATTGFTSDAEAVRDFLEFERTYGEAGLPSLYTGRLPSPHQALGDDFAEVNPHAEGAQEFQPGSMAAEAEAGSENQPSFEQDAAWYRDAQQNGDHPVFSAFEEGQWFWELGEHLEAGPFLTEQEAIAAYLAFETHVGHPAWPSLYTGPQPAARRRRAYPADRMDLADPAIAAEVRQFITDYRANLDARASGAEQVPERPRNPGLLRQLWGYLNNERGAVDPTAPLLVRDLQTALSQSGLPADRQAALSTFLSTLETDSLKIQGKPFEINFRFLRTEEGVKQVYAAVSAVLREQMAALRQPQSREQVAARAQARGMTVEQYLALSQDDLVSREKVEIGRQLTAANARQLALAVEGHRAGTVSSEELESLFALQMALQLQTARLANETSGALSQHAHAVEGDVAFVRGFEAMVARLGQQNVTAEVIDEIVSTIPTAAGLARLMESAPPATLHHMLREAAYGVWLMSGSPHVGNLLTNFPLIGLHYVHRALAARLPGKPVGLATAAERQVLARTPGLSPTQHRTLRSDGAALYQRDVVVGEAEAFRYGAFHGIMQTQHEFWRTLAHTFRSGKPRFDQNIMAVTLGQESYGAITADNVRLMNRFTRALTPKLGAWDPIGAAINGFGAALRFSGKGLMAMDDAFKTLAYRGELHALAWRDAVQKNAVAGKTPEQVFAEYADFLQHPPEPVRQLALDRAHELTLTKQLTDLGALGTLMSGPEKFQQQSAIGLLIFPFVRYFSNVIAWNVDQLPGVNLIQQRWRDDWNAGGSRRDLMMTKFGTGGLAVGGLFYLAMLGLISGSGPKDRRGRALLEATGWKRRSVRIPLTNLRVTYGSAQPWANIMGFAADLAELYPQVVEDPSLLREWEMLFYAGSLAAGENIFMPGMGEGFADLHDLLYDTSGDLFEKQAKMERLVGDVMRQGIPRGLRDLEQSFDPTIRQIRSKLEGLRANIPVASNGLSPWLDYWGDAKEVSATGYGLKLFWPFSFSVDKGLAYGPGTPEKLEAALDAGDRDTLKVWVSQELYEQGAWFEPPSATLLLTRKRGPLPEADRGVRLSPEAHNHLQLLFAQQITDGNGDILVEAYARLMASEQYAALPDGKMGGKFRQLAKVHDRFYEHAQRVFASQALEDPTLPWYRDVVVAQERQKLRRVQIQEEVPEALDTYRENLRDLLSIDR